MTLFGGDFELTLSWMDMCRFRVVSLGLGWVEWGSVEMVVWLVWGGGVVVVVVVVVVGLV